MRPSLAAALVLALASTHSGAQAPDSATVSRTFITRRDLGTAAIGLGASVLLSYFDRDIAGTAQQSRFQDSTKRRFFTRVSKVNETTLTFGGIAAYGIGRLIGSKMVTDVALHATESVVLASLASQVIRGSLGRTRPYVTGGKDQYDFQPFRGFYGDSSFDYRAYPSIHTSSSMAVATVIVMETHRRRPGATKFVAPIVFAAGILPGFARINLNQHWASDIAAGAFMGAFAGYKVVSYSHAHPNNRFDRIFLSASVMPSADGRILVSVSPSF